MPESTPSHSSSVQRPDITRLSSLLAQLYVSSTTEEELIQQYLQFSLGLLNAAGVLFFKDRRDSGQLKPSGEILSKQALEWSDTLREDLAALAARAVSDEQTIHVRLSTGSPVWLLACPTCQGQQHAVLTLVLVIGDQPVEPFLIIGQLQAALLVENINRFRDAAHGEPAHDLPALLAAALAEHTVDQAWLKLTDSIRTFTRCRQVAVGISTGGHKILLKSLSDVTRIDQRTELARCLQKGLTECLVQKVMLCSKTADGIPAELSPILQETATAANAELVLGIPLIDSLGNLAGALILLCDDAVFPAETVAAMNRANALLAGIVKHLQHTPVAKRLQPAGRRLNRLSRPGLFALLATLMLLSTLIPAPFIIKADCVAWPETVRYAVARFDAILETAMVEPGDHVQKGALLAKLDGHELNLTLAALEADYNKSMKERDSFLARGNTAAAQVTMLDAQRISRQIDLLNERRKNLQIISPVDGIVLTGDLKRTEGSPIPRGTTLFEVAPLKTMIIEVAIAEEDITYIQPGMETKIRFDAFPEANWQETIKRIRPKSEIRSQQNVFIAELIFNNKDNLLRPGMRGVAAIRAGNRPLGWILFHKPWYSLLRLFGFLT